MFLGSWTTNRSLSLELSLVLSAASTGISNAVLPVMTEVFMPVEWYIS